MREDSFRSAIRLREKREKGRGRRERLRSIEIDFEGNKIDKFKGDRSNRINHERNDIINEIIRLIRSRDKFGRNSC